jgi:DNA-binding PadR family transcriptional regulator
VSSTRLLILGVVRWFQPVHGYDVRRELLSWHADEWANVQPGSIYHALKKLAEEGLLREVATEQVGARPARTSYEITAKGEEEFQNLLNRGWWDYQPALDPFAVALAFLPAMPRHLSTAALRHRAQQLRLLTESLRLRKVAELDMEYGEHVADFMELGIAKAEIEADWCDRTADRLEKGELRASDDTARDTSRNIQP